MTPVVHLSIEEKLTLFLYELSCTEFKVFKTLSVSCSDGRLNKHKSFVSFEIV